MSAALSDRAIGFAQASLTIQTKLLLVGNEQVIIIAIGPSGRRYHAFFTRASFENALLSEYEILSDTTLRATLIVGPSVSFLEFNQWSSNRYSLPLDTNLVRRQWRWVSRQSISID